MSKRFLTVVLPLVALMAAGIWLLVEGRERRHSEAIVPSHAEADPALLHGRVTTIAGATYAGRLRFGDDEEASWSHHFNGVRKANRWSSYVPSEQLPVERNRIEIFGATLWNREEPVDLKRPFSVPLGQIVRLDADLNDVRVTLRSGTVEILDRNDASDFDDGVTVWDRDRGTRRLDARMVKSIEFYPAPKGASPVPRIFGTVRTNQAVFTGFIQWDRRESLIADTLDGRSGDGPLSIRYGEIAALEPRGDSTVVHRRDGSSIVLTGGREVDRRNHGLYVEDPRYGHVLVAWDAIERVDLEPGRGGPSYEEFTPGAPLSGSVTTREGEQASGRIVFDLDESETIEALDVSAGGFDYRIPFDRIVSIERIAPERFMVELRGGERLELLPRGDLGPQNGGMLVFGADDDSVRYFGWTRVVRIDFDSSSQSAATE